MISYAQQTQEMEMYGMLTSDIHSQILTRPDLEMVVAGILSDVQEMGSNKEFMRKKLNLAKFILFEMMDQKERV